MSGLYDAIGDMGSSVGDLYDAANTAINDPDTLTDPQKMMDAKMKEAQYETAVEFEASLLKDWKSMMQTVAQA